MRLLRRSNTEAPAVAPVGGPDERGFPREERELAATDIVPEGQTALSTPEEELPSGVQLMIELEAAGGISPVSLDLSDPTLPFEKWVALGFAFGRVKRSSSWWIGDWINFGEASYGEKYAAAVEVTGLNPETLSNYSSVARNVPKSRRRAELPFAVHAEVAKMEPSDQAEWLQRAVEGGWTRAMLRSEIRAVERGEPEEGGGSPGGRVSKGERLEQAARLVIARAQRDGPEYRVEAEAFEQLIAVAGEE